VLRVHLLPGQKVASVQAFGDDADLKISDVAHVAPRSAPVSVHDDFFPFGGEGAADPVEAGHVAEIKLGSKAGKRKVTLTIA